ncbi:hypothetical protein MKX47_20545 [Solibacillus sp. FSL R7-0668]|uniref:hypothetical protein n=1 Tax=Solibacillus sp. FSL R7-0668 TaxID=2921688 RepID=UPI0030FB81EA
MQDNVTDLISSFQASLDKAQKPAKNAQKAEMHAENERIRGSYESRLEAFNKDTKK